jgi:hypothetical protein
MCVAETARTFKGSSLFGSGPAHRRHAASSLRRCALEPPTTISTSTQPSPPQHICSPASGFPRLFVSPTPSHMTAPFTLRWGFVLLSTSFEPLARVASEVVPLAGISPPDTPISPLLGLSESSEQVAYRCGHSLPEPQYASSLGAGADARPSPHRRPSRATFCSTRSIEGRGPSVTRWSPSPLARSLGPKALSRLSSRATARRRPTGAMPSSSPTRCV